MGSQWWYMVQEHPTPRTMKPETKREILIARRAFEAGAWYVGWNSESARQDAASRYPLPKITRPRVVKDSKGTFWRVLGDKIQFSNDGVSWPGADSSHPFCIVQAERVHIFHDLYTNPTEEVEDDS